MTQTPDLFPQSQERSADSTSTMSPETISDVVELSPHEIVSLVGYALERVRKTEARKDESDIAA